MRSAVCVVSDPPDKFSCTVIETEVYSMAIMGKDRMGWWYLGQIRSMAEEYAEKHPNSPSDSPTRESRAIDNTIWGIYNLTA